MGGAIILTHILSFDLLIIIPQLHQIVQGWFRPSTSILRGIDPVFRQGDGSPQRRVVAQCGGHHVKVDLW